MIDHAGIDAQVPQLPEGEFDLSYSQSFSVHILIHFVLVLMVAAAMLFMPKIAKRVSRHITRSVMEFGRDHRI